MIFISLLEAMECSYENLRREGPLEIGTLRKDDENTDTDVDKRKPPTTHAQYDQPRFHHVLLHPPERGNPTFAVVWRTSSYLHLLL